MASCAGTPAVSGVVPKFLSPETPEEPPELGRAILRTTRFLVKGSSSGIRDVQSPNSTVSLGPVIKGAGFSDYEKPPPAPRTGESPLLARRRSSPRVRKRKVNVFSVLKDGDFRP